jgi:hypothetical protein
MKPHIRAALAQLEAERAALEPPAPREPKECGDSWDEEMALFRARVQWRRAAKARAA